MSHYRSTARKRQTQEVGVCTCSPGLGAAKCWTSSISSVSSPWSLVPPSLGIVWFAGWEFPLTKKRTVFKISYRAKKKIVVLPFVQDYTSYQNHIPLCKRSPKERTHIVITKYNMSVSKGCCAIYVWVISQVAITHNPTKGYWHEISLNSFNYHSILVTYTGWLLQVIPLEDL